MYGGCYAFCNAEDMKSNAGSIVQERWEVLWLSQQDVESVIESVMPTEQFPIPSERDQLSRNTSRK